MNKRIKRILSAIFAVFLSAVVFAEGFSFGVEGAFALNKMNLTLGNGSESDFDFVPGFRFGGAAEYSFNEITSLQTKILFHHKNGFSYVQGGNTCKLSFMTLDIPVLLKLTFAGINNIPGRFSVFAGPNFSFRLGDYEASSGGFTSSQGKLFTPGYFAAGLEAGAEYAFTKADGFRLGFSVLMDFSDFSESSGVAARRLCFMPYVSYWF